MQTMWRDDMVGFPAHRSNYYSPAFDLEDLYFAIVYSGPARSNICGREAFLHVRPTPFQRPEFAARQVQARHYWRHTNQAKMAIVDRSMSQYRPKYARNASKSPCARQNPSIERLRSHVLT